MKIVPIRDGDLKAGIDLVKLPNLSSFLPQMVIGFVVSGVLGYFAIAWLMRFLSQKPLKIFSIYCAALAVIVLIVNYAR